MPMDMGIRWNATIARLNVQADALLDMANIQTNAILVNRWTNWWRLIPEQPPFQVGKPAVLLHLRRTSLAS
jgi:hypothetical protein